MKLCGETNAMKKLEAGNRLTVEGDRWFEEAINQGAKPHDLDAEIKRIPRKKKGQKSKELTYNLFKKFSAFCLDKGFPDYPQASVKTKPG